MNFYRSAMIAALLVLALAACTGPEAEPTPLARDNLMYARQPDVQFQPVSNPTAIHVSAGGRQGVEVGDAVTVDDDGQARLRFSDFLVVDVYRNSAVSRIEYEGSVDPSAPPVFKMRLEGGSVFSNLNAQVIAGQRVVPRQQIKTDWAVIEALGTRYWVHYDEDRELTWVVVKEGVVSVTGAGVEVLVQAGQQTWVEPGKAPVATIAACRYLIGDLFPLIDELTNQARPDLELLCQDSEELDSAQLVRPTAAAEISTPAPVRRPASAAQPVPSNRSMPSVDCPVIELTGPGDGAVFAGADANISLSWNSSRGLATNEYFKAVLDYPHEGQTWQDIWSTGNTSVGVPDYLHGLLADPRVVTWRVSLWRKVANGQDVQVCPDSDQWRFTWVAASAPAPIPADKPPHTPTPADTPTHTPTPTDTPIHTPTVDWYRLCIDSCTSIYNECVYQCSVCFGNCEFCTARCRSAQIRCNSNCTVK